MTIGTHTNIKYRDQEGAYQSELLRAQAQAEQDELMRKGSAQMIKDSRDGRYGVPRKTVGGSLMRGPADQSFTASDAPGNIPSGTEISTTGSVDLGVSGSTHPELDTDKLAERMNMYAGAAQQFLGYNRRQV